MFAQHPDPILADALRRCGQDHVLRHWDALDGGQRARLAAQLAGLDLGLVGRLVERLAQSEAAPADYGPFDRVSRWPLPHAEASRRRSAGEAALRAGRVACLTVAGGQGTRLGLDGPKGAVAIGPISGLSLFGLFAARIGALRRRYGCALPWLVMTSPTNDAQTRELFARHGCWGLDPASIFPFPQGTLPALSSEGRLILEAPDRVFESPDGHGGTVQALARAGLLDRLREGGVDLLYYFQVDNPLAVIADPVFLGEHLVQGAEMSTKVVRKTGPAEKVGVLGREGGRDVLIEYSDLPAALRDAVDAEGGLLYWAGNIAVHCFDLAFLQRVAGDVDLPLHLARKPVPRWSPTGVEPVPAVKFERFVFDLLPLARRTAALEVDRDREFAPVKNATGVDSLESSRRALVAEWARWLALAGVEVPRDAGGQVATDIEIDPAYALDAEELAAKPVAERPPRPTGHPWHLR